MPDSGRRTRNKNNSSPPGNCEQLPGGLIHLNEVDFLTSETILDHDFLHIQVPACFDIRDNDVCDIIRIHQVCNFLLCVDAVPILIHAPNAGGDFSKAHKVF